MIKKTLALVGLTLSFSTSAAILSLDSSYGSGTITRDTTSGLDWLDVTVTRGLSYDQVLDEMAPGGAYTGWRYATVTDLNQLITNFGYTAINHDCLEPAQYCDYMGGDNLIVETMIKTLGDTLDAFLDSTGAAYDTDENGAGHTWGLLAAEEPDSVVIRAGFIHDRELVRRESGLLWTDNNDRVTTDFGGALRGRSDVELGSFLVSPSAVPVPATIWLFSSALIGLVGVSRKK